MRFSDLAMDGGDDERDAGRDAGRIRKRRFSSARIQPVSSKFTPLFSNFVLLDKNQKGYAK